MRANCVLHATLFIVVGSFTNCGSAEKNVEVAVTRQPLLSVNWVLRSQGAPSWRTGSASVFDAQRKRTLLFGGYSETHSRPARDEWEYDGTAWSNRVTGLPFGRNVFSMTFDSARNQVVLFGGAGDSQRLDDTWVKEGENWTEKSPAHKPPPRSYHSLAFDPERNVVVLFGGFINDTHSNDTWEWNGSDWTEMAPAQVPPGRIGHALARDPTGGGVLLYGGQWVPPPPMPGVNPVPFAQTLYDDTWRWNGAGWVQLSGGPGKRRGALMVADTARKRVILFGGDGPNGSLNDTWEWDGTAWSEVHTQRAPPAGSGFTLAYDSERFRVVWSNGVSAWEYDSVDWTERPVPGGLSPRRNHGLAFDSARNEQVLFGGEVTPLSEVNQTWVGKDGTWRLGQGKLVGPQWGVPHLIYETAAASPLLFFDGQTLRWNGTAWSAVSSLSAPNARWNNALAYDEERKSVWLYTTTIDPPPGVSQIWEWNGTSWTQHNPVDSPPPRADAALVYDMARKVTVLFGGQFTDTHSRTLYNDTWEWDGNNWSQKKTVNSPKPRISHQMVYAREANRVILFGGEVEGGVDNQTWQYDGNNWEQLTPVESPTARDQHAMTYDTQTGHVVLVGGRSAIQGAMSDVWEFRLCQTGVPCDSGSGGGAGGGNTGTGGANGGTGGGRGTGGSTGLTGGDVGNRGLVVGTCGCAQANAAWPFAALFALLLLRGARRKT
ncbi:MAG: hypothetical protein K1X64_07670 [Myxococcaceae bacterium]|nr:hypothetical protein [Myxococcaceae bacterium]